MAKMTGGRFLAETALGYGITHVFWMPYIGPRVIMELESLGGKGVQVHSEKAAVYMADAYARVRGGPSLCMAQSVGALNLAAGLQDPYLACSPVVAITGRETQIHQQRHAYQEVDHVNPFAAVTKYSAFVSKPEEFPVYLRQAFRAATTGTPAPAHIDVEGIAGQMVIDQEADVEVCVEEPFGRIPPFRPMADLASISEALEVLGRAERPVIVAGGGVTASGARAELIELAEKLSIPVATSLNAKAMFPSDHALAVGTPGSYSRACANQTVSEADLVFFVGSHAGGQVTNGYQIPAQGTRVLQLDINAEEIGRNYHVQVGLHGDVRETLRAMVGQAAASEGNKTWLTRVVELVQAYKEDSSEHYNSDVSPMRPERLCKELSNCLPEDAILVSDTGHAGVWCAQMIDLKSPDQSFIRAAGSLGWALPAAMGAKCGAPERPVVCFTGDGGVWYHMTELDTARKAGINTVTLINNNHSLNQEQGGIEGTYGQRSSASDAHWLFPEVDFVRMAEAMDCFGVTVNKPGELEGALDQALNAGKPAVVDVKTNVEGIADRAWMPQ
ncbi:MAG TPA: thiamine pyrophosphate-binding protein [Alphaproteobacteria bacterium]|nr:thiamine pyrophosphate-binding protein [Alphaproteobacteria bacterium]HIN92497.1 thiamine pyrophosphate-binding protein [Alphaproteobacteria bacterium]